MCGRFTLKTPVANWLADLFPNWTDNSTLIPAEWTRARYNIAPTQPILVARCKADGSPTIENMRWGLVPAWASSLSAGYSMINARSESIAEKPSFRPSLVDKRCVIIADGYYEWKKLNPKAKEPYWIHLAGERVFAMAGLWAVNRKIQNPLSSEQPILSATIITTSSNDDVAGVHDRMPALLTDATQIQSWLDPALNQANLTDRLLEQLQTCPIGLLQMRLVSNRVNSPANDAPELLDAQPL
jgi:putative SOS response-associated peptidase YedK